MAKNKIDKVLNPLIDIDKIKAPLITDKSTGLIDKNSYTFIVDPKMKKNEIKEIIQAFFLVKVVKVNTSNLANKKRRVGQFVGMKPKYKKAIVKLAAGETINIFSES
jgi:large subunit ribosomal protein L23